MKWLVGTFFEFEFARRRPHPADVSGKGVLEKVLTGTVETLLSCYGCPRHERIPGELVNLWVVHAVAMSHQDRYVVTGAAHVGIGEKLPAMIVDIVLDGLLKPRARPNMPRDGTDVRLNYRKRDLHKNFPSAWLTVQRPKAEHPPCHRRRPRGIELTARGCLRHRNGRDRCFHRTHDEAHPWFAFAHRYGAQDDGAERGDGAVMAHSMLIGMTRTT